MDPLFSALAQKPLEARMHAPEYEQGILSYLLSNTVAKQVLPSLGLTKGQVTRLHRAATTELNQIANAQISKFKIDSDCTLDRVAFSASRQKPMSERQIIVYFLPNYELWQSKLELFKEIRSLGVDVVCSNYRGCGKSTGFPVSEQPLIDDGLAQVQQLIDQGAKPENIALFGYSLGGGVSMAVASNLEDYGISVNVINERSFRSLGAAITAMEFFGASVAASGAKALGWDLPSEEHLEKLKGRVVIIHNDYDNVIEHPASLKAALDSKTYPNKAKITRIAMEKTRTRDQHNRAWTAQEKRVIFDAIKSGFAARHV